MYGSGLRAVDSLVLSLPIRIIVVLGEIHDPIIVITVVNVISLELFK